MNSLRIGTFYDWALKIKAKLCFFPFYLFIRFSIFRLKSAKFHACLCLIHGWWRRRRRRTWLPPQKPWAEQHQYSELGSHSASVVPSSRGASAPQRPSERYGDAAAAVALGGSFSAGRPTSGTGAAKRKRLLDGLINQRIVEIIRYCTVMCSAQSTVSVWLVVIEEWGYSILHCPKSNPKFRDITWNVVENRILHEIFRVVSRFPRYISCYIAENRFPLGQCISQFHPQCPFES